MNKGLYVNAEYLSLIIKECMPTWRGQPGSGSYGKDMIRKEDVLKVIESMLEIKER